MSLKTLDAEFCISKYYSVSVKIKKKKVKKRAREICLQFRATNKRCTGNLLQVYVIKVSRVYFPEKTSTVL